MTDVRRNSDESGDEYEDLPAESESILQEEYFRKLKRDLSAKYNAVSSHLLASKEPVEKRRQIDTLLREYHDALDIVSQAYVKLKAKLDACSDLKTEIKDMISREISEKVSAAMSNTVASGSSSRASYASVAERSKVMQKEKIAIPRGPIVNVPHSVSFVIAPKQNESGFKSAIDTKKALMQSVVPAEVGLNVTRIQMRSSSKSVKIEASKVDLDKLRVLPALKSAGLEVRDADKLNPRLMVNNIPADMDSDTVRKEIIRHNLSDGCVDVNNEDIKMIYKYPARNRAYTSWVIETSPYIRRLFINKERIFVGWSSCRVRDHVQVTQCFKCLGFGHVATNCSKAPRCGHCSAAHETRNCEKKDTPPICANCKEAKLSHLGHSALDAKSCPIFSRKLKDKVSNINYG